MGRIRNSIRIPWYKNKAKVRDESCGFEFYGYLESNAVS